MRAIFRAKLIRSQAAASGKPLWSAPSPRLHCGRTGGALCLTGVSAPPTAIPGGMLYVYSGYLGGLGGAGTNVLPAWSVDGK